MMKLEEDEEEFLEALIEYGKEVYGGEKLWKLLKEVELPVPEDSFSKDFRELAGIEISLDEQRVINSLQEKNLLRLDVKELESGSGAVKEDEFWRSNRQKKFLGFKEELLTELKES